jgi:hypothetical protein
MCPWEGQIACQSRALTTGELALDNPQLLGIFTVRSEPSFSHVRDLTKNNYFP